MQEHALPAQTSSIYGDSAMIFTEFFTPSTSVANWQRPNNKLVQSYFQQAAKSPLFGIKNVFSVSDLSEQLTQSLPDALGKEQAIKDIQLLADMLTCLFDCQEVGLRLAALDDAMCPRFHVDNIPVRLITTYCGAGTQWLPNELVSIDSPQQNGNRSGIQYDFVDRDIKQLTSFDVALLKGSAFDPAHASAIHRSCPVDAGEQRVLLTLDPL